MPGAIDADDALDEAQVSVELPPGLIVVALATNIINGAEPTLATICAFAATASALTAKVSKQIFLQTD
jgi:hypothetical protein